MIALIDTRIQVQFQKFTNAFQRLTGHTKYAWQRVMLVLEFTSVVIAVDPYIMQLAVPLSLLGVWCALLYARVTRRERQFFSSLTPPYEEYYNPQFRRFFATIDVVTICGLLVVGDGWLASAFAADLSYIYFASCLPCPPTKSTFRQAFEKGIAWLKSLPAAAPEPAAS